MLTVAPSGYYAWRGRRPSARAVRDGQLARQLRLIHAEHRRAYGRPRLHRALRAAGVRIGERRVRRLMRAVGLEAHGRRRFRVTTDSAHRQPVAANLLGRAFRVAVPNRVWAADITFLGTQEGWVYLAVVLDLASRRIVGWAVRSTLHSDLVVAALRMAFSRRRVAPGLVHHSDQGCQYASAEYRRVLDAHHCCVSMSRRGDCWDNAPVESFFSSLKAELQPAPVWPTREASAMAIADYIERFYNARRLHSALDYRSPADFERTLRVAV